MENELFARWADELASPVAPVRRPDVQHEAGPEPHIEPMVAAPAHEADFVDIPLSQFDAYWRQKNEASAAVTGNDSAHSQVVAPGSVPSTAESALQAFTNLLGTFVAPSTAIHSPEATPPLGSEQRGPATIQPSEQQSTERRDDFLRRHPRTVKLAGVIAVATLAAGSYTFLHHEPAGPEKLVAASGNLINQGAKIASLDLGSRAAIRIPVDGFSKPLMFVENNQPVEPETTLNDTVSITLAPRADKKGNPLPLAQVKDGQFVVNRANIKVKATFDNYLALNIDCAAQPTAKQRYCVDGSSVALKPTGKLSAKTATELNNLLMKNGSDFDTYYQGVKAKLAVASLQSIEKESCGKQLYATADDVIRALLKNQSAKAKVSFVKDSRYPSLSKDYAASFTGVLKDTAFSIERGDSKNAIADSLQVSCQLMPITSKGEK